MRIYLQDLDKATERIENRDCKICVVGVGTIGLPLATFLANAGFRVIGLDINKKRVDEINSKNVAFEYVEILKKTIESGNLHATSDSQNAISGSDVVFICVPTPLNKDKEIDLSKLLDASMDIAKHLEPGMLLVFESSVLISTTRKVGMFIEEKTGMKMAKDFGIAYCPERYNPTLSTNLNPKIHINEKTTNYTYNNTGRVIGGVDEKSLNLAKKIYSQIINAEIKELTSIEATEATKLLENIFRDVNIALVNELAKSFPKLGLNIYETIEGAKTKPFAFLAHYPGPGVGGECIPVDTWYLIKQLEGIGIDTKLLKIVREINDSMPYHVVEILEEELRNFGKEINGSTISILGLSYKKSVHDTRLSPAFTIMEILKSKNAIVKVCDPVVETLNNNNSNELTPLSEVFMNSDAIVLVTDHDIFSEIDFENVKQQMRTPIIIDGRNFFDKERATSFGFSYRAIGKP